MGVSVDYIHSDFLLQAFDTEIAWTWEVADGEHGMFYDVAAPSYFEHAQVEVTRTIHLASAIGAHRAVELYVKLNYAGPENQRPALNLGLLNFHAIRVPGS
jgi:hypothetical protein